MRTALLAALCASLTGCAAFGSRPHVVVPTRVVVPVAVSCVRETPDKPALVSDEDLKAMNEYQLPLALYRDREQRQGYEAKLEAIIEVCK